MSDPARDRPLTFGDVAELDPATHGGELERGSFLPVTRYTWRHGEVVGNAYALLRAYARSHAGWSVSVGDPGTKLHRDPDTLRGPDVGVIRIERRPTGTGQDGWLEGAPDLAVEVSGDAQRFSDLMEKALEYIAAGAQMVWLLDPEPRRVVVCTPPNAVLALAGDEVLDGGDVLPGFTCRVDELFD